MTRGRSSPRGTHCEQTYFLYYAQARNGRNSHGFVHYELSLSANSEYHLKKKKLLLRKYVFLRFRAQQSI